MKDKERNKTYDDLDSAEFCILQSKIQEIEKELKNYTTNITKAIDYELQDKDSQGKLLFGRALRLLVIQDDFKAALKFIEKEINEYIELEKVCFNK